MNIFSKYLSRNKSDDGLQTLITHWDTIESVVISVFKGKEATAEHEALYAPAKQWFDGNYGTWSADLQPIWAACLVGGEPAPEDPFIRIAKANTAEEFLGDWVAMQNLAAAREALNRLIVLKSGKA